MMRALLCLALVASLPVDARAGHDRPPRAAAKSRAAAPAGASPSDPAKPAPGSCSYVQPGVKVCSALPDGNGSFDVVTAIPAAIFVRTEEPIINFVPPDPHYFQADKRDTSVVIAPVQERLPDTTPTIITTKTLTITLRIHQGTQRDADTQVSIRDPLRNQRSAELAEAVAQAEKHASERVTAQLVATELEAVAREGVAIGHARGHTIARSSSFAVLEAREVLRIGQRRLLLFALENRGSAPFQIAGVRLWTGERSVSQVEWKLDRSVVTPAAEARGVVELPVGTRAAKVKLAVDELDPRRGVELDGVEVR